MSNQYNLAYATDLNEGLRVVPIQPVFISGDDQAHCFVISVNRNGKEEKLTGATVRGYFIRPDDVTITLEGEVNEAGRAVLSLNSSCYNKQGRFQVVIRAIIDGVKSTVFCGEGRILLSATDSFIDEEDIVPSLDDLLAQIATIEDAVNRANAAADKANSAVGATPNLTIGTVETLAPGSDATATITGTAEDPVLNLGLPRGTDGMGAVRTVNGQAGDVVLGASDVGASPSDHTHTAEDVGAASAGYGYGEAVIDAGSLLADESALNDALDAVLNTMANGETKQIRFSISKVEDITIGDWAWKGTLFKPSGSYATLTAESSFGNRVTAISKAKAGGSWQSWEWINPPMAFDTEYRTTERYNSKPVYVKLINAGTSADGKTIEYGITRDRILDVQVTTVSAPIIQRAAGETATSSAYYASFYATSNNVTLVCKESMVGSPCHVFVKYIK